MTYYLWAVALISALFGTLMLAASDRVAKSVNDLANRQIFDLAGKLNRFLPRQMQRFSAFCGQVILAVDDLLLPSRRSLGLVLIMVAIYLAFKLYLIGWGRG